MIRDLFGGYVTYEGNIAPSSSFGYYVRRNITITEWGANNANNVHCMAIILLHGAVYQVM